MTESPVLGCAVLWLAGLLLGGAATASANRVDVSPGEILSRAFHNAYDLDRRLAVTLLTRNRHGEVLRQRVEVASKRIEGRLHTLAYVTEPERVLGTRILTIENEQRSYDSFVFLPSLRTIRRVTSSKRNQSFLGTDLTYEEFERRRTDDFLVESKRTARIGIDPVFLIAARPRLASGYDRIEFIIAVSDYALLESRYYKKGARRPFRVVEAPRNSMTTFDGHVLPKRIVVRSLEAGTETEIRVEQLAVNPDLDDRLFTAKSLEYGPPIPGLD